MTSPQQRNRHFVDDLLHLIQCGLTPYFREVISRIHGRSLWEAATDMDSSKAHLSNALDISLLVNLYFKYKDDINKSLPGIDEVRAFIHEMHTLQQVRNDWAHRKGFSDDRVQDAFYMGKTLLEILQAHEQFSDLHRLQADFDREVRSQLLIDAPAKPTVGTDARSIQAPSRITAGATEIIATSRGIVSSAEPQRRVKHKSVSMTPVDTPSIEHSQVLPPTTGISAVASQPRNTTPSATLGASTRSDPKASTGSLSTKLPPETVVASSRTTQTLTHQGHLSGVPVQEGEHTRSFRDFFCSARILGAEHEKLEILSRICATCPDWPGVVYTAGEDETRGTIELLKRQGINFESNCPEPGSGSMPFARQQDSCGNSDSEYIARIVVARSGDNSTYSIGHPRFILHLSPPIALDVYAKDITSLMSGDSQVQCIILTTNANIDQMYVSKSIVNLDIGCLRLIYGALLKSGNGTKNREWVRLSDGSLSSIRNMSGAGSVDAVKVALGIFERAQLIEQCPEAPESYRIQPVNPPVRDNPHHSSGKVEERWLARLRIPTTINTAKVCTELDISPLALDRLLDTTSSISIDRGTRGIVIRTLPQTQSSTERGKNETKLLRLLGEHRKEEFLKKKAVVDYIEDRANVCRHAFLAPYVGEFAGSCRTACDVCTGKADRNRRRMVPVPRAIPREFEI